MAEQRLLDLAKAQHLEFARLLEELSQEPLRETLPGSKLGGTKTLQPEAWLSCSLSKRQRSWSRASKRPTIASPPLGGLESRPEAEAVRPEAALSYASCSEFTEDDATAL